MVVTRPSQPRRANAPVFYPQHRPSGGSGGWYSPLALRIRDALRGRLSILMPILVTATMPAMAMTRTAATTATTIQSTLFSLRRLDDRKSCRELRQIGCLTGGPERKRESSDELLDVVVSKKQ